ncbi:MAG: Long-chain-fatty-acid--CoA ligase [Alphaproteobacteria bacterium MarineAlpha11_Bin1]|mgnify:CR=1 FL=1|nr:MAG: Long-chain-fatty-acid--CoA ligase [Alphaproteobacteria bacterium MarineAlpha11_Bin1]|tara:strand:- start:7774 stop:9294 length:1521 start_codon:yes stop_codon:yes gene_type:complete
MNLAGFLHDAAYQTPEAPALALGNEIVATYAQHSDRSSRLAEALLALPGIEPGDHVAIAMKNAPEYSEIMFGAWHAGLAIVPMNARLHPKEFSYILDNAGAKVCFVDGDLIDVIGSITDNIPDLKHLIQAPSTGYAEMVAGNSREVFPVKGDDLAWLFYTSGTTGRPKGAMLTHANLRAMNAAYFGSVDDIKPTDCIIHAAPYSHGSGLYLVPHVERSACQVIPVSGGFDPAEVLDLLQTWSGTTIFMAPTMLTRLINAPQMDEANTQNLKTIVYGGAPMYTEDCLKALDRLGPKLVQIYGQGEAPMTITVLSRALHVASDTAAYLDRLASVGKAQTGVELRIVDTDDNDLPAGQIGEILVRGDVVMRGYWNNPDASLQTLRDGWLYTGDMGTLDTDGFLTLKDRSKDLIISGGSNIYPREVEEVLLRDDRVLECSVIGRPHPDWGEEIIAFVVPKHGEVITESELDALCLEYIARFKRPKAYRFIDTLPKNNYGKVLKSELRQTV